MGHSPVSLPVLLSGVLVSMCPPKDIPAALQRHARGTRRSAPAAAPSPPPTAANTNTTTTTPTTAAAVDNAHGKLHLGIVSGSLDAVAGRIVVGILETIGPARRTRLHLSSMCFPTPRNELTDRARRLFDQHINISPDDKTQAIDRIVDAAPDFILFSDAAYDSRVFSLAHERLAPFQAALWGWGGTVAIPTLDFFFAPAVLWHGRSCALQVRTPLLGPYLAPI